MNYIISHRNCMDGLSSAFIARKSLSNFNVYFAEYNNIEDIFNLDLNKNSRVVFTDFSLKRDDMKKLASKVKSVLVLDHHVTAQQELDNLDKELDNIQIIFNMDKSGATLTFDYFDGKKLGLKRKIFEYIEDRDLWNWKLPYSEQVNEALRFLIDTNDLNSFETVYNSYKDNIEKLQQIGNILVSQIEKITVEKLNQVIPIKIQGIDFDAVNSSVFQSEIGSMICSTHNKPACVYFVNKDKQLILSFRSRDHLPDISEVAKNLGGGGHRNAAGAYLHLNKLQDLLDSKL